MQYHEVSAQYSERPGIADDVVECNRHECLARRVEHDDPNWRALTDVKRPGSQLREMSCDLDGVAGAVARDARLGIDLRTRTNLMCGASGSADYDRAEH